MSTSFIVNLNDLNKILEQIKIAERNAAGESLVDIIGQDSALLPLGLRTVDGSFNHLLPGQSQVGAADEIFPRLLTPVYINEQDGDQMPLGPPGSGAPTITNTNYDPTIPGSHSVADADPRIISNLIVDQTLNNRSALVAALVVAGVENANTAADEILAARSTLLANQATERAYETAVTSATTVQTQVGNAATELNNVLAGILDDSIEPADEQNATDVLTAAVAAATAQNSVVSTLQKIGSPQLAAASALQTSLNGLVGQATAIVAALADHDLSPQDILDISTAVVVASTLSVDATTNHTAIVTSEGTAHAATTAASTALDDLIVDYEIEISADGSVLIENRSPDIGLSPPNSAWMTFFGQFFDHGLDLVTKGGNGTIYMPLQADDPLIAGADHVFGTADDLPAHLRFMTLSRTTPFDANGNPVAGGTEAQNTTTPFVDQNQTYTSSASHQVFLREYKFTVDSADPDAVPDSHAKNTGQLLNGVNGGIANWAEVKLQAAEKLGLRMNDLDVLDVPKLEVDAYGNFIAGPNGFAQVHVTVRVVDALGNPVSTLPGEFLMEGTAAGLNLHNLPQPGNLPVLPAGQSYVASIVGTGHAFLNDIAHDAVPVAIGGVLQPDANGVVNPAGTILPNDGQGHNFQYDDEMLNSHFVTGDGRGNENIGLTAVHTIFHSEHNRLVEANKATILASGDLTVINEWLATDITQLPTTQAAIDALDWDGSRLFQAARFVTEMQYQHLVFEEFARRIQPLVDPFVFTNSADLDPAIIAEFAHTVYRFGHSMLTDTVDRLDNNLDLVDGDEQVGLIEAFLNPQLFTASGVDDETATGALVRGMSRQVGNEMDEFVVEALRNNLLGLPLDLPALNIARGRETGIPSLNESRAQIYEMTGAVDVKPYTSWIDFAQHIKHPLSIINFIAAYGTHPLITAETTLEGKRAAALAIVLGTDEDVPANPNMQPPVLAHTIHAPADRFDFLNATGIYARDGAGPHDDSLGGMNNVDLWIGGLAEELNEFGGQLGSTFNFIFEYQMEHLQNGDRFYYLSRTQGMNLLNMLEPNTFTDMVMRNTDLGDLHATHLPALLMSVPDMTFELDNLAGQANYSGDSSLDGTNPPDRSLLDPTHDDPFLQAIDPKVVRVQGVERVGVLDADGEKIYDGGILKFSGGEHVVLGGTEGNDSLYGDKGIDTLWGDGGNDYLNAGMESDNVFGGDGDDIIEDPFGDNFLRGEGGDDVIVSDLGITLMFGGDGQDFIAGVTDFKEVFAGPGNDFLLGGTDSDVLMGNEGDDWIEGGEGFDGISGGNSELFFNSIVDGHDILNGQGNDTDYDAENGDDIMVDGAGIQRNNGMDGFDWTIFKGDNSPVDADLGIRPFETREALILRDRFDSVEGLSGWKNDDILTGAAKPLVGENFADALTQAGVDRINNLRTFLGPVLGANTGNPNDVVFESDINVGGEIILGGDGSDTIRGNLGNDILDGDAWLNVRISVHASKNASGPTGAEIATFDSLTSQITWTGSGLPASWQATDSHGNGTGVTKSLSELMRTGLVNPGQLEAVREILTDTTNVGNSDPLHDRDIAVFSDIRSNYTIETVTPGGAIGDGDGDGFITVAHTPPVVGGGGGLRDSDGVDKIRNFEILSFADGNIFLDPTISNTAATGLLNITITNDVSGPGANVGDTFAVLNLLGISDADGLPPISAFTFTWEFEATPGAGDWAAIEDPVTGGPITGPTFTPTPALELEGLRIRVVGRFVDEEGIPEAVFSAPTTALAAQAVAAATAGDDVLVGTNAADFINALAGDDTITALGGDDIVIGGPGSDVADGGEGNDTAVFFGPLANFTFELTPENILQVVDVNGDEDEVIGFERLVFIDSATPLTDAQVATIVAGGTIAGVTVVSQLVANILSGVFTNDGVAGNTLTGTEFADVIFGNGGDDIIDGLGGNDLLVGGAGDDDIDSGGGNDIISGGNSTAVGNTIRARIGDETFLIGLGENGSDIVRNDGGTERISVGQVAQIDSLNLTGNVVTQAGNINILDASDDGAGNLVVTVNNKTITITDHFNDANSVLELINFNGRSFGGANLGTGDYNLVAAPTGTTTLNGGIGNDALFGTAAGDTLNGNAGNDLLLGGAGIDTLNGGDGNDIIIGAGGADVISGGQGDDVIRAGAGNDTITWDITNAGLADGRDVVDGGGAVDTFVVDGNDEEEVYRVYSNTDDFDNNAANGIVSSAANAGLTGLAAGTEIVITRNISGPVTNANIIAELAGIEEITINTRAGNDTVTAVGNFNPTSLNVNTITINGGEGNDTVDVSGLQSAHRILFRSYGGNDTIVGTLRPQDVVELAPGQNLSTYTLADNGNGTKTLSNGPHSITFNGAVLPQFQNTPPSNGNDEGITGNFEYTPSDLAGLKALVNGLQPPNAGDDDVPLGVRELSGYGNNIANPTWGSADQAFIRLTNAHYGEPDANGNRAVNPIFDGLDPRTISNILGTQEAGLPAAGNDANIFFMAMGQYIDHGLDFLPKGGNGSIQIGAPGGGGSPTNPADLTRGTVIGYDADGNPQHKNQTSPYVDQNQAYGSNSLIGQFLRESDGNQGHGMKLLAGAPDPSNPAFNLLPTLRELIQHHWDADTIFTGSHLPGGSISFRDYYTNFAINETTTGTLFDPGTGAYNPAVVTSLLSNFMGSTHPLLLDSNPFINVLDHFIAGDGRANENFALTAIHTIWARNHNHHVDGLVAAGFQGTEEEIFQAAKMINEAEYQRVVFNEYLDTLLGGLRSEGTHGFEQYDPNTDPAISNEFAAAVFRFGHSLIGQTMTVLDASGNPTQVSLFDAFLNPSNDPGVFTMPLDQLAQHGYVPKPGYAQHGVNSIIGGTVTQASEDVDFNIVDAVRNDLVRISADLFAFNVARGWDMGLGTLNQIRKDLSASTSPYVEEAVGFAGGDLSAYTSWEDFQQRNELSDAVIAQFKQAYPDLELAAADIAAFQSINPDIDIAMQSNGTGIVKGIDRLDLWVGGLAEKHINDGIVGQTFWVVLSEQFERLQDGDRFYYVDRFDNFDFYETFIDGQEFADIIARNTGMTDLPEHMFRSDEIDQDDDEDEDETGNDDDDEEDDDTDGEDDTDEDDDEDEDEEDDDDQPGDDDDNDDDGDDGTVTPPAVVGLVLAGTALTDVLTGAAGSDNIVALAGDDVVVGNAGDDAISGGEGADLINGGAGRDVIFAGTGDDQVFGGDHADMIYGEAGADRLFGGDGNDMITAGAGDDSVFGGAGNDLFVAEVGDGSDVYFGDDADGGTGIDTLDISAATVDTFVNLGSGAYPKGTATSTQTGNDTIWGIENVNTGSGNDTIIASNAVNVMNGGSGNDTYRFMTAAAADGDTILGFAPGDRVDLSAIDANTGTATNDAFTLVTGAEFTAAGQLAVSFESRADGDFTVIQGNIDGNLDADFRIEVEGHHTISNANVIA